MDITHTARVRTGLTDPDFVAVRRNFRCGWCPARPRSRRQPLGHRCVRRAAPDSDIPLRVCLVVSGWCLVLPDCAPCCRIVKRSITAMKVPGPTGLGIPGGRRASSRRIPAARRARLIDQTGRHRARLRATSWAGLGLRRSRDNTSSAGQLDLSVEDGRSPRSRRGPVRRDAFRTPSTHSFPETLANSNDREDRASRSRGAGVRP